jgi:hypothetical protein
MTLYNLSKGCNFDRLLAYAITIVLLPLLLRLGPDIHDQGLAGGKDRQGQQRRDKLRSSLEIEVHHTHSHHPYRAMFTLNLVGVPDSETSTPSESPEGEHDETRRALQHS